MSQVSRPDPKRTSDRGAPLECPHCQALNGADFSRCVRCNRPLGAGSEPPEPPPAGPRQAAAPTAAPTTAPRPSHPLPATKALLVLTTVVFVGQVLVALSRELSIEGLLLGGSVVDAVRFGAVITGKEAAVAPGGWELVAAEPWRLLSAVFVHFGALHFGLNMLGLFYLGRIAEPAIGPVRFVIVYVATGIAGFATTAAYFVLSAQVGLTAGASGALFGIMGLILGLLWRRRDPRWKVWATQAVLFSVLFGFAIQVANNSAHLGGLAVGVLFGLAAAPKVGQPSGRWQRVLAAMGLLASILALVLAQLSPLWPALEARLPPG